MAQPGPDGKKSRKRFVQAKQYLHWGLWLWGRWWRMVTDQCPGHQVWSAHDHLCALAPGSTQGSGWGHSSPHPKQRCIDSTDTYFKRNLIHFQYKISRHKTWAQINQQKKTDHSHKMSGVADTVHYCHVKVNVRYWINDQGTSFSWSKCGTHVMFAECKTCAWRLL